VSIKPGDIFILPNRENDTGVKILGISKGIITYYRVVGSGVIHALPMQNFLDIYSKSIVLCALAEFDRDLQELIYGK
jgi:hypothetical protein